MRNHIGRVFERLISLLSPPPGHHRAADVRAMAVPRARDPYVWPTMCGEDDRLVRPYVAQDRRLERHECRCQAGLRCAVHAWAVST
ncbi:hypothetical protein SSPS47_13070 [Streptomyces sp. S4.7]|nr:hypothetical protein SSPS47_13070 [Streptomyces sp. S4.7]